ncbi:hypothetical protein OIU85_005148 [Salix viminalis]|uniref:Serine hydrolase domain-containing protein n=1 Tax=Salix viminalis TaxID=40686 RepID=A0A9Q0PU12_SALVM|nr:hypothetical protein OIU85_005148 [Salix viminalis]
MDYPKNKESTFLKLRLGLSHCSGQTCIDQQWQTTARIKTGAKRSKNNIVSFLTTDKQKSPTSIHFSPTTPTASPSLSCAVSASLHGVNVTELVTFSPYPLAKAPDVSNAGRHLSAAKFHSVLQNAEGMDEWKECPDVLHWPILDSEEKEEAVIVCLSPYRLDPSGSKFTMLTLGARSPIKLRILCLHGFHQNASGFKGRTASLSRKLKSIVELILSISSLNCSVKFTRLIAPDCKGRSATDRKKADSPFDPLQNRQQTEGFNVSLSYLKTVFSQDGPFDGILGFSRGEAIKGDIDFRFAILCAGFRLFH